MLARLANEKTAADFKRNNWIIRQRCGKGIGLGMGEGYTISLPDGTGKRGDDQRRNRLCRRKMQRRHREIYAHTYRAVQLEWSVRTGSGSDWVLFRKP